MKLMNSFFTRQKQYLRIPSAPLTVVIYNLFLHLSFGFYRIPHSQFQRELGRLKHSSGMWCLMPKRLSLFLPVILVSSCITVAPEISAAAIKDDFSSKSPGKQWFVCNRPENRFSFGDTSDGRTVMTSVVSPLPKIEAFHEKHTGCIDEDTKDYKADGDERSELWEASDTWTKLGSDVWYRFDMYVDKSITPTTGRFVIGQWKEEGSARNSPLVAQRFNGRNFSVTVEQDNLAPGHPDEDNLCRVLIADQGSLASKPAGWPHGDKEPPPPKSIVTLMSRTATDGAIVATDKGCAVGILPEQYGRLPDPFGRWTTMVYHLKLTPDGSALIEVWADGVRIGRTSGRIGFKKVDPHLRQYFKFGSYRDSAAFDTTTKLDNFYRGSKRSEVDPGGKLTPD
ncbi:heparin lyase I family protein [Rhizobium leguminosarum]|uniref:heparin lyase I family protein n=1 Tax=Rhizobium leguminosarum TaxID=384 RepID=UPI001031FD18|nr:heparin lyase I family protein [Rhizobium leguminosarum]TAX38969.1 hypothetical protein ELI05_08375 [Rhizobium leguminosarum]